MYSSTKANFDADGFVILPRFLSDAVLCQLGDAIDGLQLRKDLGLDMHYVNGQVSSIHNLAHHLPFIYENCFSSLKPIAQELLGEPLSPLVFNASYFAKPAHDGLATKDHQDNAYFHFEPPSAVTCWVGLDDSDRTNGGLYYCAGSQALGALPHAPMGNLGASQALTEGDRVADRFPAQFLTLNRGDVVIHSPLVVHGSMANHSDRPRRAFNFSFAGQSAKRNERTYERYRAQLAEFLMRPRE